MELKPDYANARQNLYFVLAQRETVAATLAAHREELHSHPDDVTALNDTAWVLATNPNVSLRSGVEAVELALRAVQLTQGREPAILDTLAAAYAEAGRFPDALQTARKAVQLATDQNKSSLADSVEAKIPLYEAGTPFREMSQPSAARAGPP